MMAPLDKQRPANESLSAHHHPLSQCNYRQGDSKIEGTLANGMIKVLTDLIE